MDDSISTPPDAPSNNGASDSDHFDASINNDLLNESTDDSAAFAEPIKENGTENADAQVQVWPVSVELKTTQQHFLQWLTKKLNEMQLLGWPGPLGGLTIGKLQLREYLGGIELSSDKEPTLILSLSEPSPSRLKVLLSPGPRPYRRIIYALLLQFMVGDYPEAMGIIEKGISSNWGELLWPEANKLNKWLLSSASNPAIENANSSLDDRENSKTTDAQRIKVDNKGLIRQCLLPGTAQHFRGTMERLSYRDWQSSTGVQLAFGEERETRRELISVEPAGSPAGFNAIYATAREHYREVDITPPTRTTWHLLVRGKDSKGSATIVAFEYPDGKSTLVEFVDGAFLPHWRDAKQAIGEAFDEFARHVVSEHTGHPVNSDVIASLAKHVTETTSENPMSTQATQHMPLHAKDVHFRTLYLRCSADKIQAAIATLSPEWEGWEAAPGMRAAWRQESNPLCHKANLEVLDDPAYPRQYILGAIETVDLPSDMWVVTFTERKLIYATADESQEESERRKARAELFGQQAQIVESHLAEEQSLDWVGQGITLLKAMPSLFIVDHTCHADDLPELKLECEGTADQVLAAVANIASQWRSDNRIYRLTRQQDGSYSICSKPHGYQHYKPTEQPPAKAGGFD